MLVNTVHHYHLYKNGDQQQESVSDLNQITLFHLKSLALILMLLKLVKPSILESEAL